MDPPRKKNCDYSYETNNELFPEKVPPATKKGEDLDDEMYEKVPPAAKKGEDLYARKDELYDDPDDGAKVPPPKKPDEPVPVYGATWMSDHPNSIFTRDVVKMVDFMYVKTDWIFDLRRATIAWTNETRMSRSEVAEFSNKNTFELDTSIAGQSVEELRKRYAGKICRIDYIGFSLVSIQVQDIFRIESFVSCSRRDYGIRATIESMNKTRMSPTEAIELSNKGCFDLYVIMISTEEEAMKTRLEFMEKFAGKICKITVDYLYGITNIQEILNY